MLEYVIKKETEHLINNSGIQESQGFIKGISSLTNLARNFEVIASRKDNGERVDKVLRKSLLNKIRAHLCWEKVLMWTENLKKLQLFDYQA